MKRVLVVDDDLDTLKLLRELLQQQGHEILTARDGDEAMEILAIQTVDLILTGLWPFLTCAYLWTSIH